MNNKKKKPTPKLSKGSRPIIWCRWMDHCVRKDYGWERPEDRKTSALECESVGFKVFEDKDVLVLAISQDENNKINDTMHILKACITKRRIIK